MRIIAAQGQGTEVRLMFQGETCSCKTITPIIERGVFKSEAGELYTVLHKERVYVGMGKREELTAEKVREIFFKLGKELARIHAVSAYIPMEKMVEGCYGKTAKAMAEGLWQSEYSFDKFLSDKKDQHKVETVYFLAPEGKEKKIQDKVDEMDKVLQGVFLARNLSNEPAMYMTPSVLAEEAIRILTPLGVEVEVLGQSQIEELGMKAYLAVARGSAQEPKFIVMRWNGNPAHKDKTVLVGKGLTYDSGGYCIKTPDGMATMNHDMGGAASVIGTLFALASNKVERNVVGLVAACENMISGDSYKTGDIIGSMKGLTIEVGNTDAEGRLTLADALYYGVSKEAPDRIIDIATLTGACVQALGSYITGLVTNNSDLQAKIEYSSEKTGDLVWHLPSHDLFRDMIKGSFADLKNVSKGGAGTITAGLFLENFVDDTPWVHLDIAGTAYLSEGYGYLPKGATGAPVRLLYHFLNEETDAC